MKTLLLFSTLLFCSYRLNAKIIYVEPVKNAKYVSIDNNIIIGFDDAIMSSDLLSKITVSGSLSGVHSGKIILTPDNKKLIFKPYVPFVFNETVEVKLMHIRTSRTKDNTLSYYFHTQVCKVDNSNNEISEDEPGNFMYSNNNLVAPPLTVNISNNPTPGLIYISSTAGSGYPANLIMENIDGSVHYARQMSAQDFKRQPNGNITYFSVSRFIEENLNYIKIDTFSTGNGYRTDFHDLRVLANGHALVFSYDQQRVDMSQIITGGNPNANVTGLVLQEIDENKNVVFQWRSWDHFSILDAMGVNFFVTNIDYVHGNSIELDNDGNILLSSRHLCEITKINRTTGDIIWRFGGINNQFSFPNDSIQISYQHDARRIANGNITLFDNGNLRTPQFTRVAEYHLDEVNKIATLVWQYRCSPDRYSSSRGSCQRLNNGNTLIGWGSLIPSITEVTPSGEIALEMSLPPNVFSYRAYKSEIAVTLNLKLAIEGFYNNVTNRLNMKDTVITYLREINPPYNIADSSRSVIDSTNFKGIYKFYNTPSGTYYITTKHRNSIETWSKYGGEPLVADSVYSYDFTTSDLNAYGNNLVLNGTKYCIFSGDVNQDRFVDLVDIVLVFNDASDFESGYKVTDLNGDNLIDLADLVIVYNNSSNSVSAIIP